MKKFQFTLVVEFPDDTTNEEAERIVMNRVGSLGSAQYPVDLQTESVSTTAPPARSRSRLDLDNVLEASINKAPRDF